MEDETHITYKMNFPIISRTILDILQTGFIISDTERKRTTVNFHLKREEDVENKPIYTITNINIDLNGKEEIDDKES